MGKWANAFSAQQHSFQPASHSAGVRGLVAIYWLFNSEVSSSNRYVYAYFFTSRAAFQQSFSIFSASPFNFFRHSETFLKIFNVSRAPLVIFCDKLDIKKAQHVPSFTFCGIVRLNYAHNYHF